MKGKIIILLLILLTISSLRPSSAIEIYNFKEFELFLNKSNDTTYIIHFWATWCVPCLKELPEFNEFVDKHAREKIITV